MQLKKEEIHPRHVNELEHYQKYSESKYSTFEKLIGYGVRPRVIAEIGVGCGYSASMFLRQAPLLTFFGFCDGSTKGSHAGAIDSEWANKLLKPYKHAELILLDTQKVDALPLPFKLDFVHICDRGLSEEEKTHNLKLATKAVKKDGYILVDQGHALFCEGSERLENYSLDLLIKV